MLVEQRAENTKDRVAWSARVSLVTCSIFRWGSAGTVSNCAHMGFCVVCWCFFVSRGSNSSGLEASKWQAGGDSEQRGR